MRLDTPNKQVNAVRLLIEKNYHTPLTIEGLSAEVALSPFHLIRTFKQVYNKTPHQYLVEQRIARAKELLQNSQLSITEICFEIGYESLGSFSSLFRKTAGLSPKAYRLNSQPNARPQYIPFCMCLMHGLESSS